MGKRRVKTHYYTSPILDSNLLGMDSLGKEIQKACTSKQTYYSLEDANKQAVYLRAYLGIKNIHSYKCHYCENWHLSSQPQ